MDEKKIILFRFYPVLLALVIFIQMCCFFVSRLQINLYGFTINGSGILFPFDVYLFEIIGYCYGWEHSRQAVWINIAIHPLFYLVALACKTLPYASTMDINYVNAYNTLFKFSGYMLIGSFIGEVCGDFFSAIVVPFFKVKFNGKYSLLLIFGVSEISAFLVAFPAYMITYLPEKNNTFEMVLKIIFGTMLAKTIIAILMLPL